MTDIKNIIAGIKKRKRSSQKELFHRYAPLMRAICIRYANSYDEAEDIVQEGFIKVFTKIDQYKEKGSFEGWMKRVFINTAINQIKKEKNILFHYDLNDSNLGINQSLNNDEEYHNKEANIKEYDFTEEEIIAIINKLPEGYRFVFNLYAIEELKHKEIAALLNISVSTSKSQLNRARKSIQNCLFELAEAKSKHLEKQETERKKKSSLRLIG